jgi:hypothetical protein
MITKEQLAAGLARECDICVHLASKIDREAYDYRPTPAQRSTIELMRYLSICGIAGIRCMAASDWKLFGGYVERVAELTPEEFPEAMARQKAEIEAFFAETPAETLATQEAKLPGGGPTMPLGAAIMNGPLKWLTAYKMQLFLYAKATGAATIGTANAWAGIDWRG